MNQDHQIIEKLIDKLSLFSCLPKQAHQQIAQHAALETLAPNKVVFERGEEGRSLYVIASGQVRVTLANDQDLSHLSAGDFFGEIALLTRCRRTATVTTESETTLLHVPAEIIWPLTREYPEFEKQLGRTGAKRSEESIQKLLGE